MNSCVIAKMRYKENFQLFIQTDEALTQSEKVTDFG